MANKQTIPDISKGQVITAAWLNRIAHAAGVDELLPGSFRNGRMHLQGPARGRGSTVSGGVTPVKITVAIPSAELDLETGILTATEVELLAMPIDDFGNSIAKTSLCTPVTVYSEFKTDTSAPPEGKWRYGLIEPDKRQPSRMLLIQRECELFDEPEDEGSST